ncbi:MAG: ECF-type sigma factor, partial [Planctomycetota bacterium JB042]
MPEPEHEITRLLVAMQDGEDAARDALIPLVYDELRVLARGRLRREHGARTVSATDLVHEAYLRVLGRTGPGFDNRAHFFSAAAEAMRRVLIDRARSEEHT